MGKGSDHTTAGGPEDSYTGYAAAHEVTKSQLRLSDGHPLPMDPSPRAGFRPLRAVSGADACGWDESCDGGPRPACHSSRGTSSCGHLDVLQERACPNSSLLLPQAISTVGSNLFPGQTPSSTAVIAPVSACLTPGYTGLWLRPLCVAVSLCPACYRWVTALF